MGKPKEEKVVFNRQFKDCINSNERYLIHVGGTRSSKTYSIIQYLVYIAMCTPDQRAELFGSDMPLENIKIRVVRKWLPRLRATVYKDFLSIIRNHGLYQEKDHQKALFEYRLNDCEFVFRASGDDPQALRGEESHITYGNEANELTKEEHRQIDYRTKLKVIYDYNPSMSEHWLYDLEDDVNIKTDVFYSTYRDNKFLPAAQKKVIEDLKYTDPEQYKVYALGQRGLKSKGRIFSSWEKISHLPDGAVFWGCDFGYTKDPTAIVKCVKQDNFLYAQESLYKTGCHSNDIAAAIMLAGYNGEIVYCDHNQPLVVEELRRMSINAVKAKKGNGSVMEGIEAMKRIKVFMVEGSENLEDEYKKYSFKLKRGGDPDNDNDWENYPEDKNDHAISALRYAYTSHFVTNKDSFFFI
jgi:phage terminase large subunit